MYVLEEEVEEGLSFEEFPSPTPPSEFLKPLTSLNPSSFFETLY
jgi:hypothetical protein